MAERASTSSRNGSYSGGESWCLVIGDGSSISWPSPPPTVRKLLEELFSTQPAEALTWVHNAVWSLQAHEIMSKLQSQGFSTDVSLASPPPMEERLEIFSGRSSPATSGVDRVASNMSAEFKQIRTSRSKRNYLRSKKRANTEPNPSRSEPLKPLSIMDSVTDEIQDFHSECSDHDIRSDDDIPGSRKQSECRGSETWAEGQGESSYGIGHAFTDSSPKNRGQSEILGSGTTSRPSGLSTFLRVATSRRQVAPDDHMPIIRSNSACSTRSHSEDILVPPTINRGSWVPKHRDSELAIPGNQMMRRLSAPPPLGSRVSESNRFSMESIVSPVHSRPGSVNLNNTVIDPLNGSMHLGKKLSSTLSHGLTEPFDPAHSFSLRSLTGKQKDALTVDQRGSMQSSASEKAAQQSSHQNSDRPKQFKTLKKQHSFQSNWINQFTGTANDCESVTATDTEDVSFEFEGHRWLLQTWCAAIRDPVSCMSWPRLLWECAWLLCILHELWAALFMLVFWTDRSFPDGYEILAAAVFTFFCFDILLNCIAAFKEDGYIVYGYRRIIERYAQTWFFYDFALLVSDFCLLEFGNSVKVLQVFKLIRAIRLLRAWEDAEIFLRFFGDNAMKLILVNCCLLNVALLLLSHINASIWAAIQDDAWMLSTASNAFDRYLLSLWRAHCALTSGYEVIVDAPSHWLFSIIVSMERATLIAACIYYLVRLVLLRGGSHDEQDSLEDEVFAFLKHRHVPSMAQMSVLENVHEVCKAKKLQRCYDLLQGQALPLEIRNAVADILWASKLRSLGLVKELMDYHSLFARELMLSTFGEFVPSRTILFRSSEPSHAAYYVVSGVLEVRFTEDEDDPIDDYTSGMWAGEKAVVNFELRRGETVACKTLAELMVLSAMEFRRLLNRFDLSEVVEDLIKVNLWMGFCGRCGVFGDHFKRDCPRLQQLRENRGVFRRMVFGSSASETEHLVGKDLRVFLQDYNLERLEVPMHSHGVQHLIHLTREKIDELLEDPEVKLTEEEEMILNNSISTFRKKHATGAIKVLANSGDAENHLLFISHYKVEAGTEATLMQNDILQLLAEDNGLPGQDLASPVFLDSEDLQDLEELQEHVKRSHNLILLLTNGVLTRPWVLIEVVTAMNSGVNILPVEIQRRDIQFQYPDENYYQRLLAGDELDKSAADLLIDEGVELEDLCKALRQVFKRIAVPFSPHKTATVRKAELQDILKRCQIKKGRTSLKNAETIVQICRPKSDMSEIRPSSMQSPRATLSNVLPGGSPRPSTSPRNSPRPSGQPVFRASDRPGAPRRGSTGSNLNAAVGKSFFGKLMGKGAIEPSNNRLMPGPPGHTGTKKNLLDVGSAGSHGYGIRTPSPASPSPSTGESNESPEPESSAAADLN